MKQKVKISEALIVAGIAAFAYYRYSRMTASEKEKIVADLKEIAEKTVKELIPEGIKSLLPASLK